MNEQVFRFFRHIKVENTRIYVNHWRITRICLVCGRDAKRRKTALRRSLGLKRILPPYIPVKDQPRVRAEREAKRLALRNARNLALLERVGMHLPKV